MDGPRFDAFTRVLALAPSRRALLPLLGGLLTFSWIGAVPGEAKKKKKKKTTLCLDGQTIQASKKNKKKLIKRGAAPGACSPPPPPDCTPTCPGTACGGDDGCGAICACAPGSLCHSGVCHPCDVTCSGDSTTCGNELASALNGGGTIYACPGRYIGTFSLTAANITLIGAGEGEAPAGNTILDANGTGRVVFVSDTVNAALHGLRITGGDVPTSSGGGGILNFGRLTLTACTVHKNHADSVGGGIIHALGATGPLTLNACTVSGNTSASDGGGVLNGSGAFTTIKGSAIIDNQAGDGGGFFNRGTATFDSASSVTGNTAADAGGGGGIHNVAGTVNLNGATVSGNSAPQCVDVDGCPP